MFDWQPNRSMLPATVIPELAYPDVLAASEWLCRVFGFTERLRIGNHRVQLIIGNCAMVAVESYLTSDAFPASSKTSHAMMVRVTEVDRHYEQARDQGAHIVHPPKTFFYGERQYNVTDLGGHIWTFSQTITDTDPAEWGGTMV